MKLKQSTMAEKHTIEHDGKIYHPLGGGSYVFEENYIDYLVKNTSKDIIKISVGAQPNSSPHFGTLVVFSLGFAIAREIQSKGKKVKVFFEIVDTAPANKIEIDGVVYQTSLRKTEKFKKNIKQYFSILDDLKKWSGISYEIRYQSDFNDLDMTREIVNEIFSKKETIAQILDPKKNRLRVRIACPICNLSDKDGEKTEIKGTKVISICPKHGSFEEDSSVSVKNFEYNTPLRNLIRGLLYSRENNNKDVEYEWIRLTGSDYAGFYQEQLFYKASSYLNYKSHNLPILLYAPLITDWSGAKLSKSLYVKEGAYGYLPKYVINYNELIKKFGENGLKIIYLETKRWINEPYKLFRTYSVYYFINLLESYSCVK